MNREIQFRGKKSDNGEWIIGDLITTPFIRNETQQNIIYILDITKADYDCFEDLTEDNGIYEVDTETVCQYTGRTDKNGRKIFEWDIVRRTDLHNAKEPSVGFIKYDAENTAFLIHWTDIINCSATFPWKDRIEIIGNIFDNPELLKGGRAE